MIEAQPRLDTGSEKRVNHPVVKCQSYLVRHAAPLREHARPSHGKTIGLYAQLLHQCDVVQITMIVIAGHVTGIVIGDRASLPVRVPYTGAAAVLAGRALDLKARGGYAPDKIAPYPPDRKRCGGGHSFGPCRIAASIPRNHGSLLPNSLICQVRLVAAALYCDMSIYCAAFRAICPRH